MPDYPQPTYVDTETVAGWDYDLPADQYRRFDEVLDTHPVAWIR